MPANKSDKKKTKLHDKFYGTPLPGSVDDELPGKLIVLEGTDGSGRSTQMSRLTRWLEVEGYGVVNTGWTQSPLMQESIDRAKEGHTLNNTTFSLFYLADFADRLESTIIPALKAGFIVLADRYIYTAYARNVLRGLDKNWTRKIYSFAIRPDLVCYLKCDVEHLIPRMLKSKGLEYWEAGMDLALGADLYDSYCKYQPMLLKEFDRMAEEFNFKVVDANRSPNEIFPDLQKHIRKLLAEE
ncbi:thymidylate kinase [Candidatus Sumerlaeota bacterium]|nr:thymidylate kinase [Candidatus Sumerlaeota bacterium]